MPYVVDPVTKQRVYVRPPSSTGKTTQTSTTLRGAFGGKEDLETSEGLISLAKRAGYEPPTVKDRAMNVLRAVGRVVNVGTATVAGAVRGAVRKDMSIAQGVAQGLRENIGFGDLIREDLGVQAKSRVGKLTLGAVGLAADILFDPITYLTFGAGIGAKIGGKALSKGGTKLFQQASQEAVKSFGKKQVMNRALLNQIFESSASRNGLKGSLKEKALASGVKPQTLERISKAANGLFDAGGIKFAGKTLVTTPTLEALPGINRAVSFVKSSERISKVKGAFGKAFVYDYGRNKKLAQAFEGASNIQKQASIALIKRTEQVFKGYSKSEQEQVFSWLYENRVKVLERQKEITQKTVSELNSAFPDLAVKTIDDAKKFLPKLENFAALEITSLQKTLNKLVKPEILENTKDLRGLISEIKKHTSKIPTIRGAVKELEEPTVKEFEQIIKSIIGPQRRELELLAQELETTMRLSQGTEFLKGPIGFKVSRKAKIKSISEKIVKIQNELTDKQVLLERIVGSKRAAKTEQRANLEKLIEEIPTPKGRDLVRAIVLPGGLAESLAKMAKIDVKDAFATYVPAMKKKVRDRYLFQFSTPLGNAKFDYTKEFGNKIAKEELENNLFTAFTKQQLNILHDNLRTNTAMKVIRQFGVNTTDDLAKNLGLEKFTRKINKEGEEVSAWLPKDIHTELTDFINNKRQFGLVDDMAQVTGFDWLRGCSRDM